MTTNKNSLTAGLHALSIATLCLRKHQLQVQSQSIVQNYLITCIMRGIMPIQCAAWI